MDLLQDSIAVVGIACRFPGATSKDEYWKNLIDNKETVTFFTDKEIQDYELEFEKIKDNPNFVKARGVLSDVDKWDARFFNTLPNEAKVIDPQHRLWLENTWHAFEDAGLDPFKYKGNVGVFAGTFINTYLLNNVLRDPLKYEQYLRARTTEMFQAYIANDPMFLSTKTAYHFNLKGPAVNIQTACSTSLVAISQACSSLLSFESDVCVAGGVTVVVPQETGYIYQEGAIASADGHCRSFDKESRGTVFGNGVGTVILKRLQDAIDDNDRIYSVIRGWATNNDGNQKIGFTAPGIEGQYNVLKSAMSFADVKADEISYIEAHGTATPLGDPIEVTALTKAFRETTDKTQYCGLGSVKSNMGHLDVAAGVAGFIKIALSAYHKTVPATLHYTAPNPRIKFETSPFYVLAENMKWDKPKPLILGVSSFGVGGTNAHVIVSDYSQNKERSKQTDTGLLIHSARTPEVLNQMNANMSEYVSRQLELNIADICYTLQKRRAVFSYRSYAVSSSNDTKNVKFVNAREEVSYSELVFMFPGQGAQIVSMGKQLYESEPFFKQTLDSCFEIYSSLTGKDFKEILFAAESEEATRLLAQTQYTQPALFVIEYSLACLYKHFGIEANAYIGHSIGEYAAACMSGVFDLRTAIAVVLKRGELMQSMPEGNMMAVPCNADALKELSSDLFEIAADNSHQMCTISFEESAFDEVKKLLDSKELRYIPLQTSHAFHSKAFDPILKEFAEYVDSFSMNEPQIPFISCLTGEYITQEQATSGQYWADQLRNTVLFKQGVSTLVDDVDVVFLEVGPNTHLAGLVLQNDNVERKHDIVKTLAKKDIQTDKQKFNASLGELWIRGFEVDFDLFYKEQPNFVDLPLYPFEKVRHWIDFKLNNREIKSIASQSAEDVKEIASSVSETQSSIEFISSIWKESFGIDNIEPTDDFIQIGGHSLLALQILTSVKEKYSVNIGLQEFLENPTIENLNKIVSERSGGGYEEISGLTHLSETEKLPITDTQKRLFYIAQLNDESPAYNIPFTIKFEGELNVSVLKNALTLILQRHNILQATFKPVDGDVYCFIKEDPDLQITEVDFTDIAGSARLETLQQYIGDDSRKVFDLQTDIPYRLSIVKTGSNEYYLHLTVHHIVFDGVSCVLFTRELNYIYNELLESEPISLPEVEFQQYDYAQWEIDNKDTKALDESKEFWKKNLDGINPLINFPTDRARSETPSGYGIKEKIVFPKEISAKLNEISRQENVTIFHTVLSAFSLLIQKYSNDEDFCIGSPITHRPHKQVEDMLGMFVNTITFRYNYEGIGSFRDLLHKTRQIALDAISHQDLSFDKVVEMVQPERHTLYNPIFQIAFSWMNSIAEPIGNEKLSSSVASMPQGIAPFDLTCYMWENGDVIEGEIEFNIDIFDYSTILRIKENFITLLESLVENIEKPLAQIDFVAPEQKKQLIEWNDTDSPYENTISIHSKLETQAQLHPNNKAILWNDIELTYKEFNEHANRLAHYLIDQGVVKDRLVGVCIERCPEMMIAIYAILKAGGAYLPIDSALPTDRIRTIIGDADPVLLLTIERSSANIPDDISCPVTRIDGIMSKPLTDKSHNPDVEIDSHNLAYVIYTSGSTGVPKGVMIEHHSVHNRIGWMQDEYPISENDILIQKTPISFDVSVWELFWWSFQGAALHVLQPGDEKDPERLIDAIAKYKVSVMHFVPSMFGAFISYIDSSKRMDELTSLRNIFLSGEAFPAGMVNDFYRYMDEHSSPDLINLYGPTEATVDVSHYPCPRTTAMETMYIGKTIANTKLLVINKDNQILPVGIPGELVITGVNLSRGYINREELNKEKFIDLPYLDGTKVRAYRTGDFVKQTETGDIFYIGRIDNQVKLRGYRIELGEIEALLTEYKDITEAVVLAADIGQGLKQLIAFAKTATADTFSEPDAKQYLGSKLPTYMVPDSIVAMVDFPLSANGKIDRKKLSLNIKDYIKTEKKETVLANADELSSMHKDLFLIWKDILKKDDFGIEDNFFNIGGNSLLAITLVEKVKQKFNLDISLRIFFDAPTIKEYSHNIRHLFYKKNNIKTETTTGGSRIISGEI